MHRRTFAFVVLLFPALAQETGLVRRDLLARTTFEERTGLLLHNDKIELTILMTGASLVNLVRLDDPEKLSPYWNPVRMARESGQKPPAGNGFGHFVCVDGFGPVSAEERAAGLPGHGEAHTVPFEVDYEGRISNYVKLSLSADLPLLEERFRRTFRLVDGESVIYVNSELESKVGFDRPACWAEHATIGSPFLAPEVTVVDMSGNRGKTLRHPPKQAIPLRLASFQDFEWPNAPLIAGGTVNLRSTPASPNSLDHITCLMDPVRKLEWVTAINTAKRLILGYVFRREDYPWLQDWEYFPANLKMARGLEFSSQPFDVPRREAIQTNSMFDAATYRWLPAKSKIESRFLLFYSKTPEGFRKVDDVRMEGGKVIVEDRQAGRQIELKASLPL